MASSFVTWWQIDKGKSGDSDRFYFLGLQITVDCDCRCKIKRFLLLGWKDMTNLDSILKSKDIILPTKIHLVKAMFFPIVMYGCESWNHKEGWESNNWYFWIVVLEKTVESPFAARRVHCSQSQRKSTLNIYWKDCYGSWSSNPLATWCEPLTHWERSWCWGRLKAKEKEWQRMRWLDSITALMNMNSS